MIDREYHTYLKLERGLSDNSVTAYELDFKRLKTYMEAHQIDVVRATFDDLQAFVFETFKDKNNKQIIKKTPKIFFKKSFLVGQSKKKQIFRFIAKNAKKYQTVEKTLCKRQKTNLPLLKTKLKEEKN